MKRFFLLSFVPRRIAAAGLLAAAPGLRTWYGATGNRRNRATAATPAKGSLESVGLGATWTLPVSPSWSWMVAAESRCLFGDAADSPIVQDRNQYTIGTMVTYTY